MLAARAPAARALAARALAARAFATWTFAATFAAWTFAACALAACALAACALAACATPDVAPGAPTRPAAGAASGEGSASAASGDAGSSDAPTSSQAGDASASAGSSDPGGSARSGNAGASAGSSSAGASAGSSGAGASSRAGDASASDEPDESGVAGAPTQGDAEQGAVTVAPPPVAPAPPPPPIAADAGPERWLKGSTHVHARPSGDSAEPIADVVAWYEKRGYDFIFLTDHNKVSELDPAASTAGQVTLRPMPRSGLVVFSGIELTHNPSDCIPPGDASGKCRIHVNLLGPTVRPPGKVVWANRKTHDRIAKYEAALAEQKRLGGLAQLNHPNWFWGMTPDVLVALARRGFALVEIANTAFAAWNDGDKDHPSTDALWDAALTRGATLWGIASDDAHDYGPGGGKYPAGGGWIVVRAQRDPSAILAAIAAGRFYASTGVVLERAEVVGDALVVELAPRQRATIEWIENGKRVGRATTRSAKRALPATGYLRAVVLRDDGKRAWVQPARR